jgi:GT2 family glycosyltransferase
MRRRPQVDIVLGGMRHFGAGAAPLAPEGEITLQLSCGLFRRRVFETVGRFDPTLWQCDDWDWFMRARELGVGMLLHRDVVVRHRLHEANLTRDREAVTRYQAMMFKRSLERRRARNGVAVALPPLSAFLEPEASRPQP